MKRLTLPTEQLSAETRHLCDVMNNESDLACVVIGAAYLDAVLADLLNGKFTASTGPEKNALRVSDKLLEPRGALGSFMARADLAYCLGLVRQPHYQDICRIAKVRNRLAHHHLQLSFQDETIRGLCSRLNEWRVTATSREEEDSAQLTVEQLRTVARNQFNTSVILIVNRLLLTALEQEKGTRPADTKPKLLRATACTGPGGVAKLEEGERDNAVKSEPPGVG
jgi:DNA-binding MltR family transcriptional regulator